MRSRYDNEFGFSSLSLPSADRILFYDYSALSLGWLSPDSNFSISTTTLSLAAALTITTSITSPKVIGGTGTTSSLTLQSTSATGASGADIICKVGDNGGTEALRITYDGKVGLNCTPATALLELAFSGAAYPSVLYGMYFSTLDPVQFAFRKSRGTKATPTNVANADGLAYWAFQAYSGATWFDTVAMNVIVDGTFTSGQRPPARFDFYTNIANGSQTLSLSIYGDGGIIMPRIPSGATQAAAGAVAGELWKTATHATLPDNTVMIGT